jgi:diguanylate cyclase (GGDEF)-like protein
MSNKGNAATIFIFIISYLVLIGLLFFFTFKILLNHFIEIEKKINYVHLDAVVSNIDEDIIRMTNSINDYSKWDDTYNYINTRDNNYIYDNFREETDTLEYLQVDGILITTKDDKVLFSKFLNGMKTQNVELVKKILQEFKGVEEYATIFSYQGKYFYFVKSAVFKSDSSGNSNGSIIAFKQITQKLLDSNNKVFRVIKIVQNIKKNDREFKKVYTNFKTEVHVELNENYIQNSIFYFKNKASKPIFILFTQNNREIIQNTKATIYLANTVISLFLLFIFFILYKNQKLANDKNETLDILVKQRTEQLERAFRELKDKNEELYELAHTDFLTKTKNRGSFFQESEKLLGKAVQYNKEFCILLIDLDHFKNINDTYGHATGDKVLIKFCQIVTELLDDRAVFGRIGGEEFCISFFDVSIDKVARISEKIRQECKKTIIDIDNEKVKFTISMGLSCREHIIDIDKIIHNADELLYEAKQTGRDKLVRPFRRNAH